ncbi:MAG: tripartite tricarboxylate transporter substrate binding protein [Xanthobacteraceae bacterium]|nr:tripartite tricarboxylate transporter substrate binding protein [Xanthobacteraceae bacterium]
MTISRRTLLAAAASTPLAALLPRRALAAYPDKPIRLIVPFAAGGNADLVARIVAEAMSPSLGQTIVVESRAGAGGSIGAAAVATAAPDGYTLLTGSNGPLTVNPFVQAKLPYDPLKDFVPVGLANLAPHSIVLHSSVQVKTLAELVELSKKQQITLGTSGVGSASHMTLARFNAATGAKLVHVPYRGGGALVGDVLGGTISGAMTEVSTLLEHHGQGKVRILAVAANKRPAKIPDVPTMIESGVKDFTAASYVGVLAPAKTPADIISMLEKALVRALAEKSTQDKFIASGAELVPDEFQTSKGFAGYIAKEYANSKEAAQLAGLKPE